MAFREVAGQKKYFKYADCEPGDVLVEGKFLKEFQGKFGVQYEFEHKDGEIYVLNSAGHLNYKMEFVRVGDVVRITYEGMKTVEKGAMKGKDAHQFRIERDDSAEVGEMLEGSGPDQEDALDDGDAVDDLAAFDGM